MKIKISNAFFLTCVFLLAIFGGSTTQAASPPGAYCATIPTGCQLLNVDVYPMNPTWSPGSNNYTITSIPKLLVIKKYCNNGAFGISYQQIEGTQDFYVHYPGTSGYVAPTKESSSSGSGAASGTFSCP